MQLKQAYELGVQLAMEEAGLVKEASRFRQWLAQHAGNIVGKSHGGEYAARESVEALQPLLAGNPNQELVRLLSLKNTGVVSDTANPMRTLLDPKRLVSELTPKTSPSGLAMNWTPKNEALRVHDYPGEVENRHVERIVHYPQVLRDKKLGKTLVSTRKTKPANVPLP